MAQFTIVRRTVGFNGDNTRKGQLLAVSGEASKYIGSRHYSLVGKGEVDLTGNTQWVDRKQEASVLAQIKADKPATQIKSAVTEIVQEAAMDNLANTSGGWFQNVRNIFPSVPIGGNIEFGKKRMWLPFLIVAGVFAVLVGGVFLSTGTKRRR